VEDPVTVTATIPADMRDLFDEPALGHLSYLGGTGQIVTFPVWVELDGDVIQVSSPVGSRKGRALRERPQAAVSIVSTKNPFHWLSVSGRVVDIVPDEDLRVIDRLARRYVGGDYDDRRPREVFRIAVDRVSHSGAWR
jgi:PPOX class probable F420-dependent enzyme